MPHPRLAIAVLAAALGAAAAHAGRAVRPSLVRPSLLRTITTSAMNDRLGPFVAARGRDRGSPLHPSRSRPAHPRHPLPAPLPRAGPLGRRFLRARLRLRRLPPRRRVGSPPRRRIPLAPLVTSRVQLFSVGLDPDAERTAGEWFESLGYRTLTGDERFDKGFWGGVIRHSDPRLAVSVCVGDGDVSVARDYDFANWLPVPAVVDQLAQTFPEAKFLLFESPPDAWFRSAAIEAGAAARLGAKCGCGGADLALRSRIRVRRRDASVSPTRTRACGSGPGIGDARRGRRAGVEGRVRRARRAGEVERPGRAVTGRPRERRGGFGSAPSGWSRTIAQFAGFAEDPDAFAAAHPFEPHLVDIARERRWSVAVFVLVGVLGLAILVVPNPYAGRGGGRGCQGGVRVLTRGNTVKSGRHAS